MNIFTRIGSEGKHGEAITTRPLLMHGIARHTRHGQQSYLSISSLHAKASRVANLLSRISYWIRSYRDSAEQLARAFRWPTLLRLIFRHFCSVPPPSNPILAQMEAANCRI